MADEYDASSVEAKWQQRWFDSDICHPKPVPGQKKFFLMFAYPGMSGYLHVGHMRGYTYSDIITRFKRMDGYNVLFPVGAHPSGNIAQAFSRKIERNIPGHIDMLKANGCDDATIERLKDPLEVVKFFTDVYIDDYWKKFGFLAAYDCFTTTVDPGYQKFIQWQFRKLDKAGMLIQKPYFGSACLNCGPVAVDASETDISQGGNAEKQEWTLLKFKMGDEFVVAATLRPETVYGQTNFWANPDVEYVRARVNGEVWILSPEGAEKLSFQKDSVEIIGKVPAKDLIGKIVTAPVIDREIPILPSSFTNPDYGTGLVTSVPSDAPYDWIALLDLMNDPATCEKFGIDIEMVKAIKPIPIIRSKGYGDNPGVEIVEKMGITDQADPRLEEATKEIYKAGFHTGIMRDVCGEYAGLTVSIAKDQVKEMMLDIGVADIMHDLSELVICRCGEKVIMKKIPDQWFIDYGNEKVTEAAKAFVPKMNILPREYKESMPATLDWFKERACTRLGNWLGTRLPQDERWIIEPISDSTLYSAFYIISPYINNGKIREEQLDDAFFDLAFLGKGDIPSVSESTGIPSETLEEVRKDFEYWYPLDVNLGGKEHMTVHFPLFLMNHAAILPETDWPRGIMVNWWISGKSGKMSKSKGGAEPIPDAANKFTVDGMRLYYSHIANPFVDVEWNEASVFNGRQRLERIWGFANELMEMEGKPDEYLDSWLNSKMSSHILYVREALDNFELREASNRIFFEIMSDIRWYVRRGGSNSQTIQKALNTWFRMMAPFTPHIAEELWEMLGGEGIVSTADFPEASEFKMDENVLMAENYVRDVQADVSDILKMTGMTPARICIYIAPEWKKTLFGMGLDLLQNGRIDMGQLMKQAMADNDMKQRSKEVSSLAGRIMKDASKFSDGDRKKLSSGIDESDVLSSAIEFLSREFKCEVNVFQADEPDIYDPQNKKNAAFPFKPGIYIE
ncbi:MAG: leucine--tRNA ligase [Thermoplasmata archaeon]|nr:leucine--tRNA ligase [Thermoplasmata archaeon]